ncbi:MAG TPA: PLD nuclease N-terminal domain-containing protein [Terrimesophilobacter sp.]|jgi:hypothetical protein|uniref:PLD nuclease N-terminal domain-containing protein n=1 Tax=Terrimesophilobacter sp. TaxID=2906435 RepID=UPI002F9268B3
MARLWVVLAVALVFFTVYALVDCLVTDNARVRAIPKPVWVLVIILISPVGGILWLTIGKDRSGGRGGSRRETAPDDDPAFLHRLGSDREQEERIRRLEQELADLDDDSKDT